MIVNQRKNVPWCRHGFYWKEAPTGWVGAYHIVAALTALLLLRRRSWGYLLADVCRALLVPLLGAIGRHAG